MKLSHSVSELLLMLIPFWSHPCLSLVAPNPTQSPGPAENATDVMVSSAADRRWVWCNHDHGCFGDMQCQMVESCLHYAGGNLSLIHCGFRCWTWVVESTAVELSQPAPTAPPAKR
ncbi:hypothetical protein ACJ72_08632 [Emergomyces africanus]|uniref:Uncharacterized protein n=1 Tax=Emergomyces africanus TaxID=1955775 RepID=A0A1B7NJT0_9EURO|nr:hypothetical protein ACJ72_08632 [Emergomyces africanus]